MHYKYVISFFIEYLHLSKNIISFTGIALKSVVFCLMPKVDLGPLEDICRAKVLKMIKVEDKIADTFINNLMNRKHTGFYVAKFYNQLKYHM